MTGVVIPLLPFFADRPELVEGHFDASLSLSTYFFILNGTSSNMKNSDLFLLCKNILFVLLVGGTVLGLIPFLLLPDREYAADWIAIAGGLIALPGLMIIFVCVRDFRKTGRGTPAPIDPPKELVVVGLYRFVRNPMYIGVLTVLCGESMILHSFTHMIYFLIVFLGFHLFVVLYEEPTLGKKFGSPYADYRKRVPRWIPKFAGSGLN